MSRKSKTAQVAEEPEAAADVGAQLAMGAPEEIPLLAPNNAGGSTTIRPSLPNLMVYPLHTRPQEMEERRPGREIGS